MTGEQNQGQQKGPAFLTKPYEEWPIKLTFCMDRMEGELVAKGVHCVTIAMLEDITDRLDRLLTNCRNITILHGATVNLLRIFKVARIGGAGAGKIQQMFEKLKIDLNQPKTSEELQTAKILWCKFVQNPMKKDLLESVSKLTIDVIHS